MYKVADITNNVTSNQIVGNNSSVNVAASVSVNYINEFSYANTLSLYELSNEELLLLLCEIKCEGI